MVSSIAAWLRGLAALALLLAGISASAAGPVGVVLLHGKGAMPESLAPLAAALKEAGYRVAVPEMPWSKARLFNASADDALKEVDAVVAGLRKQGAATVVIGGHSTGANMAIAYAARRPGVSAVVALAPGLLVESAAFRQTLGESVSRAAAAVREGKGGEIDEFDDLHLGKVGQIATTAAIYFSYFDPQGVANMPANVPRLKAPLLWAVGNGDQEMFGLGRAYAFDRAPASRFNRYLVVEADHMGTPDAARRQVVQWLGEVLAP